MYVEAMIRPLPVAQMFQRARCQRPVRLVALVLVLALLPQLSPCVCPLPFFCSPGARESTPILSVLKVCNGDNSFGGIFADRVLLPPMKAECPTIASAPFSFLPPIQNPASGHRQRLLRPPRTASSL